MKLNVTHIATTMHDFGVEFASTHGPFFANHPREVVQSSSYPARYQPFMRGLSESLNMNPATLGAMIAEERYTKNGYVECLSGNMLVLFIKGSDAHALDVYHGELDTKPFIFGSIAPQLPGTLFGMGRSGICWAQPIPTTFKDHPSAIISLYEYGPGEADINEIHGIKSFHPEATLAAPWPMKSITRQRTHKDKQSPTNEVYARAKLDNADPHDLVIIFDSIKRDITFVRGSGGEMTLTLWSSAE